MQSRQPIWNWVEVTWVLVRVVTVFCIEVTVVWYRFSIVTDLLSGNGG